MRAGCESLKLWHTYRVFESLPVDAAAGRVPRRRHLFGWTLESRIHPLLTCLAFSAEVCKGPSFHAERAA